jgi:hypothetical protein
MGDSRDAYRVLMGRPEWETRRGWEDNIRMDPEEVGLGGMDWIDLAQDSAADGLLCMR